jgi:tRNA A-37 threonylcarbamoyl transferase component Bud32
MPKFASCPKGHQWEVDGASRETCPVCGMALPPDADATLINQPGWKAQATAGGQDVRPRLPGFDIVGELGRGGMGIVYKARQAGKNRTVAIKVIRKDRLVHEEAVRRFRREAQAAARLSHPNIVLLYDSDKAGDTHYLVMEYVQGVTLERLVEKHGPLAVPQACAYMRQVAIGLQHAFEQSLVHRDIKPANLMVTWPDARPGEAPPDGAGIVKILDMGVARLYNQAPGESLTTLTQGGVVIGTADFIAPEQLEDPHGADIRADLYSLGCTFYLLLTGRVPFPGGSVIQKLDRQRWETPPAVDQLRDGIPAGVVAIIRKLMAKAPAERYATPAELAADIDRLGRSGVGTAAAAPAVKETRCFTGHHDGVWSVAIAPDKAWAVSAGKDRTLRVWDLGNGKERRVPTPQSHEVLAVAVSPSGAQMLSAAGVSVRLWDAASGQELGRFTGHTDAVRSVAFSPDGRRALSAGDDKTVRVWEVPSARETSRFTRHTAGITSLAVHADGQRVLSGGGDNPLRLWELHSGKELRALTMPRGQVYHVALSPDGHLAVSSHFDTFVRLWDLESGRELRRFQGHKQRVTAALFTPDARRIISASQDHTLRLWDVDSGCEVACFNGHAGGVTCLALNTDGTFALSGSADHTLRLWELPS